MALSYSSYLDQRLICPGPAGTDGVTGATGPKGDPGTDAGLRYYFIAESTGPSGATSPQPALNDVTNFLALRAPNNVTTNNPIQTNFRGYYTHINGSGPTGPTSPVGGYVTNLLGEFRTQAGDPGLTPFPASVWNFTLYLYSWIPVLSGGSTINGVRVFVQVFKNESGVETLLASNISLPISIDKIISDDTPYTFDVVVPLGTLANPASNFFVFRFYAYTTAVGGYVTNQEVELWTEGDFLSRVVTGIPNANGNTGATGPTGSTGATGPSGPGVDPTTATGSILYWNGTSVLGNSNLVYNTPTVGSLNFGQSGTATGPVITWSTDTDTGIWRPAANTIAVSTNATEKLRIDETGAIILGNSGTATGPTIVWTGDTDTGIWKPAANILAVSTNATEKLRIDATGAIILGNSGTATGPAITWTGDVDTGIWRPGANTIAASTNAVERVRITDTGNVGIGTSSPGCKLQIIDTPTGASPGTPSASTHLSVLDTVTSLSTESVLAEIGAHSRIVGNFGAIYKYQLGYLNTSGGNGGNFVINAVPVAAATYNADGTIVNRLTIDNAGRLGIGESTPASKIHLQGDTNSNTELRVSSTDGYISRLGLYERLGSSYWGTYIRHNGSTNQLEVGQTVSNTDSSPFITMTNSTTVPFVGINKSGASHELDVDGIIRGRGSIVYVESATYNMTSSYNSISATSYTDLISLSYTPKQSGSITLLIDARYEVKMTSSGGDDGGNFRITDGTPTELAFNTLYTPGGFNLLSTVSVISPLRYIGSFSGVQTFKLQYQCFSGGVFDIRRGILTVYEISSVP
jgi:hypothetical protein